MGRLFGTDGVRGIANADLSNDLAYKLGQAGAYVLTNEVHKAKILIGRDTRISGSMLEASMVAGICSVGAQAILAGVITTPAVALLTKQYDVDAGVMISASHNSVEYNGIKFFSKQGYKLSDEIEEQIESIILDHPEVIQLPQGNLVGNSVIIANAAREYIDFLLSTGERLDGMKVVLDCANGAASAIAPQVFRSLGATVYAYHNSPDGTNINEKCGSTNPQMLQQLVVELDADVGLAFDGDADRLIAVDELGNLVDGDRIMGICAYYMKERGLLKKNTLVSTVMSNIGLEMDLKANGCEMVKTKVGDRYVLERMLKDGYNLGGEQSGHIIFLDYNATGDGILTGIQLLKIVHASPKPFSSLARKIKIYPQVLVNAQIGHAKGDDYLKDEVIMRHIAELEEKFAAEGRVLIRPSGTEPLVRVMIEGKDKRNIEMEAYKLVKLIEKRLAGRP
ncbi:MAG: phosphoglucosamine mutase [Christensenellales bacterium]|jgi:phosphoglucosamine mutase